MGGAKKKPISKVAKALERARRKEAEKGKKTKVKVEKIIRDFRVTSDLLEKIRQEVPKKRAITPSTISLEYNIKVGVAKEILRTLNDEGLIRLVSKGRGVEIYAPAS